MFEVMAALLAGLLIGKLMAKQTAIQPYFSKVTLCAVIGLLFIMGVQIGSNPEVLASLPTLGGKALVLALVTAAGSVLCSLPLARSLHKGERAE